MNILVIEDAASSTFGGAERTMRSYCEYLAQSHRLHLVYDRAGDYSRDLADIYATVTRISLHPLRVQPALRWQKELLRLVRLCRREKIDLILTHVVHALSALRIVRFLSRTRTVFIFKWVCSTEQVGWQARWGLKGIESGISVSRFVAGYWIKNGFPEHKMCVIPEGIPVDDESGNPRVDPSHSKEPLTVGFAGRIVPEKGLHILIDAIAQFKASGKPIKCLVAGAFDAERSGSSYHSAIRKQVCDLGLVADVDFLGYITPLTGFIRQIDVMVVPSVCQDAQPIVLLESMITGTPVIASQVGGVPEMMIGPLETWVVASKSSSGLFAKLVEFDALNARERAQLGRFVRRYAATNYSIEACHQRLTERIGLQPNACTA